MREGVRVRCPTPVDGRDSANERERQTDMPTNVANSTRNRAQIGQGLKKTRERLIPHVTQAELAKRMGYLNQQIFSRYEAGRLEPTVSTIYQIEEALGVPHGTVLRNAGMIDDVDTVEARILADPKLRPDLAEVVLSTYSACVRQTEAGK